jgi:hypothetical protein
MQIIYYALPGHPLIFKVNPRRSTVMGSTVVATPDAIMRA